MSRRPLLLALAATAAAYVGVHQAGLVWDDHPLLAGNAVLEAPSWSGVFARDLWSPTGAAPSAYHRPVMTLSLLVDRWLLGGSTDAAHLHNLAWHLLNVGLVGVLLTPRLGPTRAAVGAAVFGLHPVQSEAVVWVSARNDLLVAAGVLVALSALDHRRSPALAAFAVAFACLAKESGYSAPLILLTWRLAWGERPRRADAWAMLLGVGAALAVRAGATVGHAEDVPRLAPDHPWALAYAAIQYLGWAAAGWPLTGTATVYQPPPPLAWIGAAAALALGATAVVGMPRRAVGLVGFAAVVLAPAFVVVRATSMLGERYLYLAMVAVAAMAGAAPARTSFRALGAVAGVTAIVALHVRLPEWHDDTTFFRAAALRSDQGFAWYMFGWERDNAGDALAAITASERSVAVPPHLPFACRRLADTAVQTLDAASLRARLPRWEADGCRDVVGFDDPIFLRLYTDGAWDLLDARLRDQRVQDGSGRSAFVRGVTRLDDGDWTAPMAAAARHDGGPAAYLDGVYGYALARRP